MRRLLLIFGLFLTVLSYSQTTIDTIAVIGESPNTRGGDSRKVAYRKANNNDQSLNARADSSKAIFDYEDATATVNSIQFNTEVATSPWKAGQMEYDSGDRTFGFGTGVPNVIVQGGQELHQTAINKTADTLFNGTPVFGSVVDAATGLFTLDSAKASSLLTSLSIMGLVTADIPPDSIGFITKFGKVRDFPTDHLVVSRGGFLGINGGITAVPPTWPNQIVIIGGTQVVDADSGRFFVDMIFITRPLANKSYSFTSNGIGAGIYYVGGFYESPLLDGTLDEITPTQAYGSSGNPYGAHAFIVSGGNGTTDAGQVGLRVIGTSGTDNTAYDVTDTAIITTDITTLALDSMIETPEKWASTVTFELYEVSGSPTAYSLDMNYGLCKYEDFGNVDFTITKVEAIGLAGANDASYDMSLMHHTNTGWTYAASGFIPGNGEIADWSDTYAPNDNLVNGDSFAWKVTPINQFIQGDSDEGVIVRIVTGANNSVQSMNVHIIGVVEGF